MLNILTDCSCHPNGSLSMSCDTETGACQCQENVTGEKCDTCFLQYYGINSGMAVKVFSISSVLECMMYIYIYNIYVACNLKTT